MMNSSIEPKLREIADVLFRGMREEKTKPEGIGLLAGEMGILIFCKHYLRAFPDPAKERILAQWLDAYFDTLTSGAELLTYCSGLTGALEGLKYLNREKLLEVDYSDIEINYKKYMQRFALDGIRNRNYDFLHGGVGVVRYFADDAEFVNQALEALEQTAIKEDDKYKWVSLLGSEGKYGYNIALSHGCSSIISVLCALTAPGIDLELRDRIVRNACNYILSQEIDPAQYGCFFPTQSLDNDPEQPVRRSRMGWCYGDLGIATTLWQAGKLLGNEMWQHKALQVLEHAAQRRDLREGGINDAGLCHGAASVCMMFHYAALQTGNPLFAETRDYWLARTLELGHDADGLAGYRVWHGELGYVTEYGMLEGIAGIGLMLLALLTKAVDDAKWMKFFLLN